MARDQARTRDADGMLEKLPAVGEIERHIDGTEVVDGEPQPQRVGPVRKPGEDRIVLPDALLLEGRRGLEHDPPQFAIGPFLARRREPHEHLVRRLTRPPVEQRPQHARLRVGNARIGEATAHRNSRRACGVVVRSRRCDRRMSLEAIRSDDA